MLPTITKTPIGVATVETVNARDLHAALENRDHFATWIKDRIRVYGFTQHIDFKTFSAVPEKGGRPSVEYAITLDMAKELAMVERNAKGQEVRRYFIECERRAKEAAPPPVLAIPQTYAEALEAAAKLARENEAQAERIAILEPQAAALTTIADTEGTFCIRDAAKMLDTPEKPFRGYLAGNGWIYRRGRSEPWVANATRINQGYMRTKLIAVETGTGKPWNRPQARITSRGLTVLAMRLGRPVPPGLAAPGPLIEHAAQPQGGK